MVCPTRRKSISWCLDIDLKSNREAGKVFPLIIVIEPGTDQMHVSVPLIVSIQYSMYYILLYSLCINILTLIISYLQYMYLGL